MEVHVLGLITPSRKEVVCTNLVDLLGVENTPAGLTDNTQSMARTLPCKLSQQPLLKKKIIPGKISDSLASASLRVQ